MSNRDAYYIVRRPIITEKATRGSEFNQVTFEVATDATKPEIKKAVEELFKVTVEGVNTLRVKGKTKMFRARRGTRAGYKKAMVTLKDGDYVDVTTGI